MRVQNKHEYNIYSLSKNYFLQLIDEASVFSLMKYMSYSYGSVIPISLQQVGMI